MAITVAAYGNVLSINTCENSGDWTGESPADTTDFYKEGSQCVGFTVRGAGANDVTISGSWNLSGKHLRLWFMTVTIKELNSEASNGLQIILGDGTNTAYYTVGGGDTYPGGWWNLVLDCDRTPTSGTAPTLTAVTTIGVRMNHTGTAKNSENTWIDMVHCCDGLRAYGDDSGSPFDLDDVLSADENTTNGWGVIRKIGGVFYLNGLLRFGDNASTNILDFEDSNEIVVFEDRPVDSALYDIAVVANSTGATQDFYLGSKSGGRGISGCIFKSEGSIKYTVTITDSDMHYIGIYGCNFLDAGDIFFPDYNANYEVLDCAFQECGEVDVGTGAVTYCNFINADNVAMILDSTTVNATYCNFINCPRAVEITTTGSLDFDNMQFTGNTYDIYNSSGGSVTVNATDSNPSELKIDNSSGSSTSIVNTVYITIYVKDRDLNAVQGASVAVYKTSDDSELLLELTDTNGMAQDTFNYPGSATDVYFRVRKSSPGDTRYKAISSSGQITSDGFTTTVLLDEDEVAT
jgi:hypothetical protein